MRYLFALNQRRRGQIVRGPNECVHPWILVRFLGRWNPSRHSIMSERVSQFRKPVLEKMFSTVQPTSYRGSSVGIRQTMGKLFARYTTFKADRPRRRKNAVFRCPLNAEFYEPGCSSIILGRSYHCVHFGGEFASRFDIQEIQEIDFPEALSRKMCKPGVGVL